jgi:hypothetical protein
MNRSKFSTKALMSVGALVTLAAVAGWAASADAAIQTLGPPQLLPLPAITPPPTPASLAPPINPGYAAAPADGLSPILTTPGPVYEFPQPQAPSYPLVQLPGPIDQQKMHAYANSLRAQQWQLQSQGLSTRTAISREILQQLNVPDAQ